MRGTLGALLLCAAFAGCGGSAGDTPTTTSPSAPTTTRERPATTTTVPDPPDTGRMSGGEYDSYQSVVSRFNDAAIKFTGQVSGKCTVLASAGQLAEFSNCVKDADDNLEGKAVNAYQTLGDLVAATAKTCRQDVRRARSRLDAYYTSLSSAKKAGQNLDAETYAAASKLGTQRAIRFARANRNVLRHCSPT